MPNKSLNILHLIPTLQTGGGERMVLDIAYYQRKNGINAIVGCTERGCELVTEAEKKNIPVFIFNGKKTIDLSLLYKIVKFIRLKNIHLVHTNFFESDIVGRLSAMICGIPCVSTLHNSHQWHFSKGIKNKGKRLINQVTATYFTSALIADSRFIQKHYIVNLGFKKADHFVLYNPVSVLNYQNEQSTRDTYSELGLSEDNFILLNVASLSTQKSQKDFINIIDKVRVHCPQVRLLIAGDGIMKNELDKSIKKMGISKYIKLLGRRNDIPVLLSISKIFVLCSKWEGLPISILEAMSAGKPIISTSVGGIPEIIQQGRTGFIVPYGDIEGFAKKVIDLIKNKELLEEMARNARTEALKFDISSYHTKLLKIYSRLRKKNPGSGLQLPTMKEN